MVNQKSRLNRVVLYIVVIVLAAIFAFPALWTFGNSLNDVYATVSLLPSSVHLSNYKLAVTLIPFMDYLWSSIIISGLTVVLTTVSSAVVAYGFARFRAPGKSFFFILIISTMMVPPLVTQIPTYIFFNKIGLTNTYLPWFFWGIGGNAFFIFLYRQFFLTLPKELDESARIDGCSSLGILWRILMPISIPIVVTVAVMSFQSSWGDYLTPYMFLDSTKWNLATALLGSSYTLPNNPTIILKPVIDAAAVLLTIPTIFAFFFGQKYLVEGIVTTGLKG
ncbi:ABC-type glycerol-3-phosphate transport system permease component [Pullulanibacillus pueri]|uniref:sn-glycerol-3-phosphate transport system permease protein UgpE n=1 Tax=Pullulanibacillus pueri TaxID=1437324 RepID=A0A8J3ELB4_9BACL|nr:carbohydrate ABC transporter permease [Pullulanibacillus pueri]MBM7681391.1 ABC-type glycerol-3-phosphate transport system permease component [Pullulanibacillus pueri]GGH78694.1 sn-glycerol-3-phosphate transport system permease protein UgpE [Pullulanibacillus pueri]